MANDRISVTSTIEAAPEAVYDVLADPGTHAAIDGTGWVREPLDGERLTTIGQVFRMAMHHDQHPDGDYVMANEVEVLDRPRAIAWQPGQHTDDGDLALGGWTWRYDLAPAGAGNTHVTLSYDWSAVPEQTRQNITFPPFPEAHLTSSLAHLADLATR